MSTSVIQIFRESVLHFYDPRVFEMLADICFTLYYFHTRVSRIDSSESSSSSESGSETPTAAELMTSVFVPRRCCVQGHGGDD